MFEIHVRSFTKQLIGTEVISSPCWANETQYIEVPHIADTNSKSNREKKLPAILEVTLEQFRERQALPLMKVVCSYSLVRVLT